ncbi:ESX secretion-associated protein EspG [Actinopolyspora mortivallis]|uniref:ESX secretion-associated protein EspG n=1 Tax=Actinopolyspora mortivallis TaxID=33906 RepID=A0A2T0GWU5_ACTMO|nr:ESX secretion-associated protein EspG [Actinopolyspora mortivallis]PRW63586.1 ESX secretion-associated protein EspG [Actinopolyspora mortivallis]
MVETINLSLSAVGVLGAQLNLDVRQYPFEFPPTGGTPEERDELTRRVWAELESAGLASGGEPEPEVADALYLMCSSEVSVAAAGLLDIRGGLRLAARAVSTGEVGVVGVITAHGLRLDFMDPETLPEVCVRLLPRAPAGRGGPVRVPVEALRMRARNTGEDRDTGPTEPELLARAPKYRIGHFVVSGNEGEASRLPGIVWFDTEHGRYSMRRVDASEGEVLDCSPVDHRGLVAQLTDSLDRVRRN